MDYKLSKDNPAIDKSEREDLRKYVEEKEYENIVNEVKVNRNLSLPQVLELNKNGVDKKRIVFTFSREENYFLKMVAYLLKEYDYLFYGNLYSFRNNTGVKRAIDRIRKRVNFKTTYSYKVDIHDYFNSINTNDLLKIINIKIPEEKWLYEFFSNLFKNPYALKDEKKIEIKKGIMAGTPTAGFLANLYLLDMDKWFWDKKIVYVRYSDDIIVFSDKAELIDSYESKIKEYLSIKQLAINPRKEIKTTRGEKVEFLGFEFSGKEINISDMAEKKIKGKIKRKARALYRWKIKKSANNERAVRAYIRYLNNKFYHNYIKGEITWCRWYFPLITIDDKLKVIDEYAISNIRYLCTGKYCKKNYNLRYYDIKKMGYNSLVNSFWKYKSGKYYIDDEDIASSMHM